MLMIIKRKKNRRFAKTTYETKILMLFNIVFICHTSKFFYILSTKNNLNPHQNKINT